jgi:hypothetical protein
MTESMDAMKKGGKAKRKGGKKKGKKAGDAVLLHKGNAPRSGGGVGIAQRMMSPGNLFGGGLPAPLQTVSYASAPAVARPISRMEFIGSSDAFYNRNRNRTDDIQVEVNPADIKPDMKPSIRFQPSSNPNAFPPVPYVQYNQANWYGEVPRLNEPNMKPSTVGVAPKPTTGNIQSNRAIYMDVKGVGHLDSEPQSVFANVAQSDSEPQSAFANVAQSAFEPVEPEEEPSLGAVPIPLAKTKLKIFIDEQGQELGRKKVYENPRIAPTAERAVRRQLKTLQDVQNAGYADYNEAIEAYEEGNIKMKRGGRVKSVF